MTSPKTTASAPRAAELAVDFDTQVFAKEYLDLAGSREAVVRGGRSQFGLLPQAFAGVRRIGVIGWGPQAAAQAANLRDSLRGTGITVTVGLRAGSASQEAARAAGFTEADATLGEMMEVISGSDMVLLLIADAAQAERYPEVFAALGSGTTLGLSHGFLLGHLESNGAEFPAEVDVIAVCPKGMGPSVRALYLQGEQVGGAGINASFAVHQDVTGRAVERALGWSVALGAPFTFRTTLRSEYLSDIVGERAILLGAVHGLVESLYRHYAGNGMAPEAAFLASVESLTGPISAAISRHGILGVYEQLTPAEQAIFRTAYTAVHPAALALIHEIYDDVATGAELRTVVAAGRRLGRFPLTSVEGTPMWQVGAKVRADRDGTVVPLHPFTAGIYCGVMMAQIDVLIEHGHPFSEIANESVIECVDSLNPYMHARGVSYMIDNCSTTARLGARKWAPRFDYLLTQDVLPALSHEQSPANEAFRAFLDHPIHQVLRTCAQLRPDVDIAVS